ncbi:hypothetical protein Tco_0057312 [Tanacetum coccineum]
METNEMDTPMVEKSKLDADPQRKEVNPTRYRGSTSGSMQLLVDRLVSCSLKKQKSTVISSTEAEYIALSVSLLYVATTSNIPDPSILTSDTTSSNSKWKMGWLNCISSEENISWHISLPRH